MEEAARLVEGAAAAVEADVKAPPAQARNGLFPGHENIVEAEGGFKTLVALPAFQPERALEVVERVVRHDHPLDAGKIEDLIDEALDFPLGEVLAEGG